MEHDTIEKTKTLNLIKQFDFKPYGERVVESLFDLSEMRNNELSNYFNVNIYDVKIFNIGNDINRMRRNENQFDGIDVGTIYEINYLSKYLGEIPEVNQLEIIEKHDLLSKNPIIDKLLNELMILAPHNNFEGDNNIKGIDPIVFAVCEINNQVKLIELTQWL